MYKSLLSLVFLVAPCVLFTAQPIAAQIASGDFSSGLTNWSVLGDATAINNQAIATNSSTFGDDALGLTFNFSGDEPLSAFDLETFLGFSPGTLSPVTSLFGATEGSLISQQFFGSAGSDLSFDWQFLTNDTAVEVIPGFTEADYGFVSIQSQEFSRLVVLSNSGSSSLSPSTDSFVPFERSTSINNYSLTLPSSSFYKLSFGVLDVGGSAISSALVVDNVTTENTQTPESSLVVGLLTLGFGISLKALKTR